MIDEAAWKATVDLSMTTKNADGQTVLTKAPEGLAYTNDYVQKALDTLKAQGVDVNGATVPAEDRHPHRGRRLEVSKGPLLSLFA